MKGVWNIKLLFQPPQSPDLNVLDLGFFNLIEAVGTAFEELPEVKL